MVRDRACTNADLKDSSTLTAYTHSDTQSIPMHAELELHQSIRYHFGILGCKQIAVVLLVFFISARESHKLTLLLSLYITLNQQQVGVANIPGRNMLCSVWFF